MLTCVLTVCSCYKRIVEPCRSWRSIQHAYKQMALWMKQGTAEVKKLKRYIQRHLALPRGAMGMDADDARDVFCEFGYHYTNSLLEFASDELKKSTYVFFLTLILTLTLTLLRTPLTQIFFHWVPRLRVSSDEFPLGRSVYRDNQPNNPDYLLRLTYTVCPSSCVDVYGVLPLGRLCSW